MPLNKLLKNSCRTGHQWLVPVIPATQQAEVRRITVRSQLRQIVLNPIEKTHYKKRAGGVAQGEGPEFKPQHWKKQIPVGISNEITLKQKIPVGRALTSMQCSTSKLIHERGIPVHFFRTSVDS
jgi:hypothetical protein